MLVHLKASMALGADATRDNRSAADYFGNRDRRVRKLLLAMRESSQLRCTAAQSLAETG
jgi:hypothetical protein